MFRIQSDIIPSGLKAIGPFSIDRGVHISWEGIFVPFERFLVPETMCHTYGPRWA